METTYACNHGQASQPSCVRKETLLIVRKAFAPAVVMTLLVTTLSAHAIGVAASSSGSQVISRGSTAVVASHSGADGLQSPEFGATLADGQGAPVTNRSLAHGHGAKKRATLTAPSSPTMACRARRLD